jgi:NNMT/PNMT/TEMT family
MSAGDESQSDRGDSSAATSILERPVYNNDCRWDRFNPEWYFHHNYDAVRQDDHQLLRWIREQFVHRFDLRGSFRKGIDIGAGANLYPALAMAPYCRSITLRDYAQPNVDWLQQEITKRFRPSWYDFWEVLAGEGEYKSVQDPRECLAERAVYERGSIFDLPQHAYDIGTMFFVAESITADQREFETAVRSFVHSLRSGAPFAAAFMKGSRGYQVDTESYPAVAIDSDRVRDCLAGIAYDVEIRVIELHETDEPLRDGYDGMILATGRRTKLGWGVSER